MRIKYKIIHWIWYHHKIYPFDHDSYDTWKQWACRICANKAYTKDVRVGNR